MQRLTGLDDTFLWMETSSSYMHVASLIVVDGASVAGGLTFDRVRALYESRLDEAPPFRRRLVEVPFGIHHPIWIEDPDFDLDWHLREISLPAGKGDLAGLCELAAKLVAIPLDRTRPLWELWMIEGLDDGQIGLLTKVHHAAIDGASGEELMVAILDLEPDPEPRPEPEVPVEARPRAVRHRARRLRDLVAGAATAAGGPGGPAHARRGAQGARAEPPAAHDPAAVAVQRTRDVVERTLDRRAQLRGVVAVAGHRQGGQERVRLHGQRRRAHHVRGRAAPLPRRARRASGRPARRHGPGVGALRGSEGHPRQPRLDDAHLVGHRPRRSRRAPAR